MSRALRELGLGPDADERAVKRAYAAKLKTVRPDADPEGFQRLHAAYQQALEWVRERSDQAANVAMVESPATESSSDRIDGFEPQSQAVYTETLAAEALSELLNTDDGPQAADRNFDASDDGISAQVQADGSQDSERFSLDDFLGDCATLAMNGRDGELLEWLNAQPFLWSLEHKAQIAHWLLRFLHEQRPPIEGRRFDVLADFFGLLDLNSGYDAYFIQHVRHRLQLAWETRTDQVRSLAQRTGIDGGSLASNLRQIRRMLKQIKRPLNIMQALIAALMPMYPTAVRRFIHRLDFGNLDDFPPDINPEQVAFWDAAGDRMRISKPRLQVGFLRCLVYAAIGMLGTLLVKAMTPGSVIALDIAWKAGAIMLFAMLQGWLLLLLGQACVRWQCLPEDHETRFDRWRPALIPIMALGAFLLGRQQGFTGSAIMLSMATLLLSLYRYQSRNGPIFGKPFLEMKSWHLSVFFFAIVMLTAISNRVPVYLIPGLNVVSLLLWFVDLRKQRHAAKAERETSAM